MSTATEKEMKELRAELAALKEDLANIGETVGRIAGTATDEGRQRIRSAAQSSKQQARDTISSLEHEIEERPMTSVAAAMGIGFILGRLLDR